MIKFADACALIQQIPLCLDTSKKSLAHALGATLAKDIFAGLDLPPFDNSAVDGFACASADLDAEQDLRLENCVRAQGQNVLTLTPRATTKIMTGAPVPRGADVVAMLEDVVVHGDRVRFSKTYEAKENIRFRGEDLGCGDLVARAGTKITPQIIAVCAALGFTELPVFTSPRIKIIATGDELVRPGQPLKYGQVYFLMDEMLKAQCAELGIFDVSCELVADDLAAIDRALSRALDEADIVLLTGGMSKGDYDHARTALAHNNVREVFYQGAWRPGKPLFFGVKDRTQIFGLPGNPVAAFVCFHVFVRRAINSAMKNPQAFAQFTAIAQSDIHKKIGFTFFARAMVDMNNGLEIVPGQGSHQVFNLSKANGLAVLPEAKAIVKAGEVVHYYRL